MEIEPLANKSWDFLLKSGCKRHRHLIYNHITRGHWILGIKRCCMIHSFWVPLKQEPSMFLRLDNSLVSSSFIDFLSINELSATCPKNLTGCVWMEEVKDEKSEGSEDGDTEKGVVFIDHPFIITMLLDLSALNSRPAHLRAVVQHCSRVWAPCTEEDIRFRSSIKAWSKGKGAPLERNWEAFVWNTPGWYSCLLKIK